jgi:uncharacterized integral membrane protein
MSRFLGVLAVLVVLLLAMGFTAANAGHRVTIDLGLVTLYQVPVTLVAFSGLFVGMVVMFLTGVHTDLKVRKILRDRFAEESAQEQTAIDRNQQDLFGGEPGTEVGPEEETLHDTGAGSRPEDGVEDPGRVFEGADVEAPSLEVERPSDLQQID